MITKGTDIYIRPVKNLKKLATLFNTFCTEVRMFTDGETKLTLRKVYDGDTVNA